MVAIAFLPEMAPLLRGMVTLRSVVAWPPVTTTDNTHSRLLVVATDVVVVTPAVDDARPKSLAVTPVTGSEKDAVKIIGDSVVVLVLGPCTDVNVGTGALYLARTHMQALHGAPRATKCLPSERTAP